MANEIKYPLETIPSIPHVDIFQAGKWNADVYTEADLDSMVSAFGKVGFQPPVKAGHEEGQDKNHELRQRLFGAPALGYVGRIYREGKKLFADLVNVPKRFGELIKAGTYKRISSEIFWSYRDESSNITYPRVLKAIAFLGADIPALTSLDAIECMFSKTDSGVLTYKDHGNEVRVYDKDYCGECASAPMSPGMSLPDFLLRFPRKAKDEVGYDTMSTDTPDECCAKCKFCITDWFTACSLVEGRIEPNDICDLFEPMGGTTNMGYSHKNFTVEKRGIKWAVIGADGEVISTHDTEAEAALAEEDGESENEDAKAAKMSTKLGARYASKTEGDKIMAEEKKETAEMVASFNHQIASLKSDLNEQISGVKKEYEMKISEKDAVIETLKKEREADEKRIATIEFQKKTDDVRYFLREQKKEGRLAPVEETRAEALMLSLSDSRLVKYSQDGKEIEKSELEAFKEFITKRPSLFAEQSTHDEDDNGETRSTQAYATSDESTTKAVEYMNANKGVSMRDAYKAVWEKHPKLFNEWQRSRGSQEQ